MKRNVNLCIILIILSFIVSACTKYERQVVPFKMPAAYPNVKEVAGTAIAAKSYDDKDEARAAFGFNIRKAGILPVQVIFDNQGKHYLEIMPQQTFLVDQEDNLWPILDENLVYDRVAKKTELGQVMPEAGKGGVLGGVAGGIIGAAIGIVTGTSVGEAAGKGAAVGAAAGITLGGTKGLDDPEARYTIREDLKARTLENRAIKPGEIAHGFIFFPGEAKKSKELRLQLRAADTGYVYSLVLRF